MKVYRITDEDGERVLLNRITNWSLVTKSDRKVVRIETDVNVYYIKIPLEEFDKIMDAYYSDKC